MHSPKREEDASNDQDGGVDSRVGTDSQVIDCSGKYGYIEATVVYIVSFRFLSRISHIYH